MKRLASVLVAGVVAPAAAGGATAPAPADAPAGSIVYEAGHLVPSAGVHVVNADGTGDRQLAAPIYVGPSLLEAARPEPSPQGDRVVFVRHRFAEDPARSTSRISTLAVVSLRASTRIRTLGRGDFPSWSPDGRWLAFQRLGALHVARGDGRGARRLARLDRRSFRRFTRHGDRVDLNPAWSPGGTEIAFARAGEIWIARTDGTGARRLTRSAAVADAAPVWSPDGRWIAWICGDDVCAARPDGTGRRQVSQLGDATVAVVRWSPSRAHVRLAFVASDPGSDRYELYVSQRSASRPVLRLAYDRSGYPDFAWSPDGRFVAFSHQRLVHGPAGPEYRQQISVAPTDGGPVAAVTAITGWHPRWVR